MTTKDQKFIKHWQRQEKKGMARYIILYGTSWGVLIASSSALFRSGSTSLGELYLSADFLISLAVFITTGSFFAATMWRFNKAKYKQLMKEQASSLQKIK